MNAVAKVATGGVLAVLGLVVLKFIIGLFVGLMGLTFFVLFKVVPIVLVILVAVWLVRKITARRGTVTTT